MKLLLIEPDAEADIEEAINWYDQQRDGLGADFELCLEAALDRIQQYPSAFQKV